MKKIFDMGRFLFGLPKHPGSGNTVGVWPSSGFAINSDLQASGYNIIAASGMYMASRWNPPDDMTAAQVAVLVEAGIRPFPVQSIVRVAGADTGHFFLDATHVVMRRSTFETLPTCTTDMYGPWKHLDEPRNGAPTWYLCWYKNAYKNQIVQREIIVVGDVT